MADDQMAVRVRIMGRVQGVWFRGWTVDQARRLGLAGWVRNRRDGTVEAVFAGPEAEVCAMVALCRTGPPAADVSAVVEGKAAMPAQPGFRQVPTE